MEFKDEFTEEELENFSKLPEAAFSDLKRRLERVNCMNEQEVRRKLKTFHINTEDKSDIRRLLKERYKKIIPACVNVSVHKNLLPYYVIIDFEATCERVKPSNYRHEIIEFPAVIVDTKKQEIKDFFQMFCKPQINPVISEFCTNLTGITQEQIDSAKTFEEVLEIFQKWLQRSNLGKKSNYAIVTDGPWDMSRFLYSQCYYSDVKFPSWGNKWVNLRKTFSKFYQCEKTCLKNMLEFLEMDFKGRPHCGLDDAKNIARILLKMIYDGACVQVNERICSGKNNKEKTKTGNDDVINSHGENQDLNNLLVKKKVEAHYTAVYWLEKVPAYAEARRKRLIAETSVARVISENPNVLTFDSEFLKNLPKRKKNRKNQKEFHDVFHEVLHF